MQHFSEFSGTVHSSEWYTVTNKPAFRVSPTFNDFLNEFMFIESDIENLFLARRNFAGHFFIAGRTGLAKNVS
jgi:hypothetical protein